MAVFPWRYTSCRLCIAISSWLVTELYSKSCLEASEQESGFPFHLCLGGRKVRKSGGASSNGVDILFSPNWNRVNWPTKIGGGGVGGGGGSCPPSPFNVYSPFSSLLLDNSKFSGFSPFHLWFILPVWFWFCAVLALEDLCPLQSPTFTSLLFASQDTLGPSDDRKDCYYCRETFLQCAGGLPEFLNESKWFCLK